MSEGSTVTGNGPAVGVSPYRLTSMFHPTILVPDLAESERWYERVFGLPSIRRETAFTPEQDPDNRTDFSTFVLIRDILMDFIDPKLMVVGGTQRFPAVDGPHLEGFGWYVDGIQELYQAMRGAGIKIVGINREDPGDEAPFAVQSASTMFFTLPDDIGLQYQFISPLQTTLDPRTEPNWELGSRRDDDPLGIDFTSHHTTLTKNPERMLKLFVDLLGGTVLHEARNEALGASSTYVRLADGVQEIAVPDAGTPAYEDLAPRLPHDCYHSITLKVADLEQVRRHLAAHDVTLRADTGRVIITDPKTSDGVPWGFTVDVLPGEDRC